MLEDAFFKILKQMLILFNEYNFCIFIYVCYTVLVQICVTYIKARNKIRIHCLKKINILRSFFRSVCVTYSNKLFKNALMADR